MKRLALTLCSMGLFGYAFASCGHDDKIVPPLQQQEQTSTQQTPAAEAPNPTPDPDAPKPQPEVPKNPGENAQNDTPNNGTSPNPSTPNMQNDVLITVGTAQFRATLADNATAQAFAKLLPLHVKMTEHGGNEKYYTLPQTLPTQTYTPGTINNGDLLLWGNNTVVIFYKTFTSTYSYTRIGKIDNPAGLAAALGSGNPEVSITIAPHP